MGSGPSRNSAGWISPTPDCARVDSAWRRRLPHSLPRRSRSHCGATASRRSGQGSWAADASDALAALQRMLMVPDLVDADGVARLLDEDARYFG